MIGRPLIIDHSMATPIPSVGLQVWRGALLLADFIIHQREEWKGKTVLELGAGSGLASIVMVQAGASLVFATDIGSDVLANCFKNITTNIVSTLTRQVRVRQLNWEKGWPPSHVVGSRSDLNEGADWDWTEVDIQEAAGSDVIIAADVVYSEELTDAFFRFLEVFMAKGKSKVLYLALEKRYNFSLTDLAVVATAYRHFRLQFEEVSSFETLRPQEGVSMKGFYGRNLPVGSIRQYICEYDRGNDLELWDIRYYCTNGAVEC